MLFAMLDKAPVSKWLQLNDNLTTVPISFFIFFFLGGGQFFLNLYEKRRFALPVYVRSMSRCTVYSGKIDFLLLKKRNNHPYQIIVGSTY